MQQTTSTIAEQELYETAHLEALRAFAAEADDGYGCGTSFVTIKWGTPFMRWAKKQGLVRKDAYYGWILDTNNNAVGTLARERYNMQFAKTLSDNGVHAFNHTYLT